MKKIALLMVTIILVSGLGVAVVSPMSQVSEQEEINHDQKQRKSFKTIDQGRYLNYENDESENLVIKDEEEWKRFCEKQPYRSSPFPEIDFEKNMVLVALGGMKPTGGYNIQFEEVYNLAGVITLAKYKESKPKGPVIMTSTYPYHFIITEKTGQVIFSEIKPETEQSGREMRGPGKTDLIPY